MKGIRYWALMLCAVLTACSPIALDTEDDDTIDNPPDTPNKDQVPADTSANDEGAYSVAQALAIPASDIRYIQVKGYIVGHIQNRSYRFSCPTDHANTNFLLADQPYETREAYCMPIGLNKGDEFQPELNLLDHPEHFQQRIMVGGNTSTYFGKCGIRTILTYQWLKSDTTNIHTPGIDSTRTGIINGRLSTTF